MQIKLYEAIKNQSIIEVKNIINELICESEKNNYQTIYDFFRFRDDKGRDLLQMAFNSKNKEIIQSLVNFKLKNNKNEFNEIALIRAINVGTSPIIKLVLNCDIDINQTNGKKENSLILAIKFNKLEAVNILLQSSININHVDANGNNALYYALNNKNSSLLIEKLNQHKINFSQKFKGKSSYEKNVNIFLVSAYQEKNLEIFKKLIEENKSNHNPFLLNSTDEYKNNALMFSVFYAHTDKQEKFKYIYENLNEVNHYQKNIFDKSLISMIVDQKIKENFLRYPLLNYLVEKQYFMAKEFDQTEWDKVKHLILVKELVEKIENQITTFKERDYLSEMVEVSVEKKKSLKL